MLKQELIGRRVTVLKSRNKANEGISGDVLDETMNTITIKTQNREKVMIKDQNTFGMLKDGKMIEIEGKLLKKRPEERVRL